MKPAPQNNISLLHKLENIEKEILELKLSVIKRLTPAESKAISFKGVLKGVSVTDKDVSMAKKSIYGKIKI